MAVRKFSETTCHNYIRHIAEFAKSSGLPSPLPFAIAKEGLTVGSHRARASSEADAQFQV